MADDPLALFGYQMETVNDLTFDTRDGAPFMMKARVIDQAFTWGRDRPWQTAWGKTVVHKTHARGFTMRPPGIRGELRGTYAGLASQPAIDYAHYDAGDGVTGMADGYVDMHVGATVFVYVASA